MKLEPRVVFQLASGKVIESRDFDTIPAERDVAITLSSPYFEAALSGEVIEFELVIFNALNEANSNSWRGKFRLSPDTGKIEWL